MVNLCIVKECNNSSALTMKNSIMFMLPQDELRCKNWLINCGRQDLLEKPTVRRYVCADHFEDKMYSNLDRTVLLPTAVPTDFSLIFKEHACSTSCVDTSGISDPLLFNNSVVTSTPTKQKESISITYNTPDISIGDLKHIVNNQNTKLERTEIIKLREKLDNVVEDECWELDDVFVEHNYSSAPDSTVFEEMGGRSPTNINLIT